MRRDVAIAVSIMGGGVVGGVTGGLLAAYWWDFPPEDDAYDFLTVPLYSTLGAFLGLFGAAIAVALVMAVVWTRNRARRDP
jgi:hypothetical protein